MKTRKKFCLAMVAISLLFANYALADIPFKLYAPWTYGDMWQAGGDGYFYGPGLTHRGKELYAVDFNKRPDCKWAEDEGEPILAAHSGFVTFAAYLGGYGWTVEITSDIDSRYKTKYSHLLKDPKKKDDNFSGIHVGQWVSHGHQIGRCGATGGNMSPHLHFVLFKDGSSIKPSPMSCYNLTDGLCLYSDNFNDQPSCNDLCSIYPELCDFQSTCTEVREIEGIILVWYYNQQCGDTCTADQDCCFKIAVYDSNRDELITDDLANAGICSAFSFIPAVSRKSSRSSSTSTVFTPEDIAECFGGGGSLGAGGSTLPTEPPVRGLPDFITDKVTMGSKDGKHENYTWKINETAYVHAYIDNIGDADWEGTAKKIEVPFYLSKGTKEDSHSEWIRIDDEDIKKEHLKVKDKPKHESIKFDLAEWANEGKVLPGKTYNFVVCADRPKDEDNKDGDVKEKHKSNNCSTEAVFYVEFGPPRNVDLTAGLLALTNGKTSLRAGENYGLQVEVSNIGTEPPWNGFNTSYEIKGPGTGDQWQIITDDGSDADQLYAGAVQIEHITDGFGAKAPMVGGDYMFRACADWQQVVPETDESNNCTELEVYIAPPPMPDLTAHSLHLTNGRTELYGGELYGLEVGIQNIGEVTPNSGFRSKYEIKGPGTGDVWVFVADDGSDADQLAPGATEWELITDEHGARAPMVSGNYLFRVCADYNQIVQETDENNNCIELAIYIAPPPMPDLIAHSLRLTNGRNALYGGDLYGLEVGIQNTGAVAPGSGFRSKYEIKGPGTGDAWVFVADDGSDADELAPGATQWEHITDDHGAHIPNVAGTYTARACADYQSSVAESNEENNCTETTFEVIVPECVILNPMEGLPATGDFDMAASSIDFPDTITRGDEMHPKVTNCTVSGSSPKTRATWAYARCDGTGFTRMDGDTDEGMNAGECRTEEIITDEHSANMEPGVYVIYFISNGTTQIPESDYSNNVQSKVFRVE